MLLEVAEIAPWNKETCKSLGQGGVQWYALFLMRIEMKLHNQLQRLVPKPDRYWSGADTEQL